MGHAYDVLGTLWRVKRFLNFGDKLEYLDLANNIYNAYQVGSFIYSKMPKKKNKMEQKIEEKAAKIVANKVYRRKREPLTYNREIERLNKVYNKMRTFKSDFYNGKKKFKQFNYRGKPKFMRLKRIRPTGGRLHFAANKTRPVYTTITHRELISVIGGSGKYQVFTNYVNPGMYDTYPWLANVSQAWDEYRILYMQIQYVPAAGQLTNGDVFLAFHYNSSELNTIYSNNESTIASYPGAVQGRVTERLTLNFLPRETQWSRKGWYYIRSGPINGSNVDYTSYDPALLYVATDADENVDLGRVYINYKIKFKAANPVVIPLSSDGNSSLVSSSTFNTNKENPMSQLTEFSANTPVQYKTEDNGVTVNRIQFFNGYTGDRKSVV